MAPHRIHVAFTSSAVEKYAKLIGDGLRVPVHAKERLTRILGPLSSPVTVQFDLESSEAAEVPPKSNLVLREREASRQAPFLHRPLCLQRWLIRAATASSAEDLFVSE